MVLATSIVVVAASIIFINYVYSKRYLLEFAEREMTLAAAAVSQSLIGYLGPVATATELIANAELVDRISTGPRETFFHLSEQLIDKYPQFFTIYLGLPDGSFVRTGRGNPELRDLLKIPPGTGSVRIRAMIAQQSPDTYPPHNEWYYREEGSARWMQVDVPNYELDPRIRPWYVLAEASRELQWTSVYAWAGGSLGITGAHAMRNTESEFRGVIGIDVRLADLAKFLRSIAISENSRIFIAQSDGQIVAHSESGEEHNANRTPLNITDDAFRARHGLDYRLFREAQQNGEFVTFAHEDEDIIGFAAPLAGIHGLNAVLYIAVPVIDLVGFAIRANLLSLAASVIFLGCMLILSVRIAGGISRPMEKLALLASSVRTEGVWGTQKHAGSFIREIDDAGTSFNDMLDGLREKETIRKLFGRYVPEQIAAELVQRDGALAPVIVQCTIVYVDIEGFSGISERLPARDLVEMLNTYFTAATQIIEQHNGVVTQFQGDAILATYNVPIADAMHARNAVVSAIELQNAVRTRRFADENLKIRIGVSTGEVVAGSVGAEGRLGYTVHGDVVNIAARLQEMNKKFGTRILVAGATKSACESYFDFEALGEISLRGKNKTVKVFTLPMTEALGESTPPTSQGDP